MDAIPSVLDSLLVRTMEFKGSTPNVLSIEISGAALECVNGIYKLSEGDLYGGKPMFTRSGDYDDGTRQQFIIHSGGMTSTYFYASAIPHGRMLGGYGTTKRTFYKSEATGASMPGTTEGWIPENGGAQFTGPTIGVINLIIRDCGRMNESRKVISVALPRAQNKYDLLLCIVYR
jgi:hypothetical protein